MKLLNKELELYAYIEDDLVDRLCQYGIDHYPAEYGGLLMGYYSGDCKEVYVKETVLPKKYTSSKYFFERGIMGLKDALMRLFKQQPSLIYIGEWHTHPDNPPIPSITDLLAMKQIIAHEKVNISNPILLIVGISNNKFELGFYVQFKNKIFKFEKEE